jgi:hypothetical protein
MLLLLAVVPELFVRLSATSTRARKLLLLESATVTVGVTATPGSTVVPKPPIEQEPALGLAARLDGVNARPIKATAVTTIAMTT